MAEEKTFVVKPGQKFRHIRSNAIYIVKSVTDNAVTLVSKNGEACMLIQVDDLISAGFEPIHD